MNAPDPAEDLYRQAVAAGNANDYRRARELLDRVRDLTSDADLLDRADITESRSVAELGSHADAVALCHRVLARAGVLARTRGRAHAQLGLLWMRNGDAAEAVAEFTHALEFLAEEPDQLGGVHLNRGNVHFNLGDADRAAADYAASAAHFAAAGEESGRAKAEYNLAGTHLIRGDVVAAMRDREEAGALLAEESPVSRAIVLADRAEVLLAAGRPHEAAQTLEASAAAFGDEGLRRFQAENEMLLARTLLTEDPERARIVALQAARRFRQHGSDSPAARSEAIATVAAIAAGSTGKAVLDRADELVTRLRDDRLRADADWLALHAARLAVRRGDLADGKARIAKVRVTADTPVTTRLLAREVRAELAAEQGHDGRSRMHARAGLDELHAWQSTFGSLDLQTSAVGHGQHLARLGLRAALRDGSPQVAFEWSERARALASRVTSLRPPPDPHLARDLTALRMTDPGDLARRRELRERIRARSWYAAEGTIGDPIDLVSLQEALARDDAALVAHVVLDGTITAIAVTASEATVIPLGDAAPVRALLDRISADLDFAARNREGDLAGAVRTSLRADLAQVGEALVRPVLGTIGPRRLVLTPSALLTGTPWTAIPGLIGRPLTLPPSATHWQDATARPAPAVREVGLLAGPQLARAEEEVRRARQSWPAGHVLHGSEADSARASWLAARVDLLHVAGHGQHPGDHPLFSAIELADGPWFGHDIDLLPRAPEYVVLSACDLGRSSVRHGEETVGMSAVWLHAGSRAVVSAPTLLADDLACEVFADWHHLVAGGATPSDALAQVTAATDEIVPLLTFGAGW